MGEFGELALIALGSNDFSIFGNVRETIQKAMGHVAKLSLTPAKHSHLYSTAAYPAGSGPDFVNAAMAIRTTASPQEILSNLHKIEAIAGRKRDARWEQRALDLDLIAVGGQIRPDEKTHDHWRNLDLQAQMAKAPDDLILPHPRLQDRAFVLVPLSDVAPKWVHPILNRTVADMLATCTVEDRAGVMRLDTVSGVTDLAQLS